MLETWIGSANSADMLEKITSQASARKLRLFSCACGRLVWNLLPDLDHQLLIEVAETFADGHAEPNQLDAISERCRLPKSSNSRSDATWEAAQVAMLAGLVNPQKGYYPVACASAVAEQAALSVSLTANDWQSRRLVKASARAVQADLLRCIFGPDPSQPLRFLPPEWTTSSVVSLAESAYNNRSLPDGRLNNDILLILADALEEAGCTDAAVLSHCRDPKPHVRGCWVVDLILGKS